MAASLMMAQSKDEMEGFRLTLPKVQSTIMAYSNLFELLGADEGLAVKFRAAKKALPETNGRDTIGLTAQKLAASDSRIPAAFAKAGISPKEAGMTMECLVAVIFGSAMLEASKTTPKNLPAFVSENLGFYEQNKAAVQAEFKKLETISAKAASALKDDEDEEEQGPEQP